ncbi:hypothetical protein COCVIDRAFT_22355 [Bipolaris victoriae FI3]|uniref:Uncharacterized protein n=2 Tax=Bipolaris TaxID=33194 RepID=W6YNS8_COCC2|nr:uncharacterized protein COCCADRAFT_42 [Bipolaris zeicola 26-R-13]XP_014561683.1 hypothetical protein COCVIDRAFT_22355 [Bipolaris victoriae FI3]EUC39280.1 hypothetical protein COCCADRAFT_42 [Bipolaris zeicola 26-R-13]
MKFTIVATIISMAAVAIAAPIASEQVAARQNHGMCVKSDANGEITQIPNC